MRDESERAILELQAKTRKFKRDMYRLIWSNPNRSFWAKIPITIEYWVNLRMVDIRMAWKHVKLWWRR